MRTSTASESKPPPSLMRRIVIRLSAITAVATVLAYCWLEFQTITQIESLHKDSLRSVASDIANSLTPVAGGGLPTLDIPERLRREAGQPTNGYRFAVRKSDSTIIYDSDAAMGPLPKASIKDDDGNLYERAQGDSGPKNIVGVVLTRIIDGEAYFIQVEQQNDGHLLLARAIAEDFFDDGGWAILPLLMALLVGSILTIRKTLTPLDHLSKMALTIGPETPDVRLPETDIPMEILPLVRAFNNALDRLELGYQMQRDFTADAAHELRTPLAVLRAQLDLLPSDAKTDAMLSGVNTMTRLVAQMLNAARMDILTVAPDEAADLREVAVEVTEFLSPIAIAFGKEIEVTGDEVAMPVRGHREGLFDAVRNLTENAMTYSLPGGIVTLHVTPNEIAVIDRGPGIPANAHSHLFSRFWRADQSKSGAGLGLSIVKRIADAHHATISVEDTPGGGATFRMTFPTR